MMHKVLSTTGYYVPGYYVLLEKMGTFNCGSVYPQFKVANPERMTNKMRCFSLCQNQTIQNNMQYDGNSSVFAWLIFPRK